MVGSGLSNVPSKPNDVHVIEMSQPAIQSTAGTGLKEGQCAGRQIQTQRVVPTIWLVIDGSGSMLSPLSAMSEQTRWAALYDALMNPDSGIVKALEKEVEWGVVLYDGPSPGGNPNVMLPDGGVRMLPPADTCPRVLTVEPKKEAYADISAVVGVDPLGGSTPTDKALNVVVNHLEDMTGQVLDGRVNPTIVVLATDGEPNDFCGGGQQQGGFLGFPMPVDVRPQVISAVQQLASMNIKTYVISLAGEDQNLTAHLNEVAAAGDTGLEPFFPTTKDSLVQAFKDIIGPPTACDVVLNGSVKAGLECMGTIKINGATLPCNDPNGWALKDPSTVVIQGTACESYKNDLQAILEADFPCELIELN
jgi:Mg-chelatase subunit ChlD